MEDFNTFEAFSAMEKNECLKRLKPIFLIQQKRESSICFVCCQLSLFFSTTGGYKVERVSNFANHFYDDVVDCTVQ
jgi:hypothetical protein